MNPGSISNSEFLVYDRARDSVESYYHHRDPVRAVPFFFVSLIIAICADEPHP